MTEKFSLFKLPYVALCAVLNHVRPYDILPLSLCSKRSQLLVKSYQSPSKNVDINFKVVLRSLEVNSRNLISVDSIYNLRQPFEIVTIGSQKVAVTKDFWGLKTYWADQKEGMKEVIKYTSRIFDRKVHEIYAEEDMVSSDDFDDWMV